LGRGFADTFLIPYSEKFWTVHPRDMTHEWTGNRVPQPSTWQVLRGALWSRQTRIGTNVDFRYPCSAPGYGSISEALAEQVGHIHRGHRARRFDVLARTLHFDNGASVAYQRLISTIPLPDLVALCPDAPPEVRAAAARLRANSICVVNLGIGRPGRNAWHWAHYPEKEFSFFRISFPHNLADNVTPPGMSSISAEVAYSAQRPLDHAGIVQRVTDDLIRVGVLERNDPIVFSATRDIRYAYCIHDFARKDAVRTIRDWMLMHNIVPTGRYGHWNYFWSHESIMSGLQAGEKALKDLNGQAADIEACAVDA
jgi:UDP-galactopyranose mutase